MRYYAIGDIHGRADLLTALHRLVADDIAAHLGESTLVYLGDYVDRGPDTKGVLDQLIACSIGTSRIFLKGNHEDMLLGFLQHPKRGRRWLNAGGLEAARSYGITSKPSKTDDLLAFVFRCG